MSGRTTSGPEATGGVQQSDDGITGILNRGTQLARVRQRTQTENAPVVVFAHDDRSVKFSGAPKHKRPPPFPRCPPQAATLPSLFTDIILCFRQKYKAFPAPAKNFFVPPLAQLCERRSARMKLPGKAAPAGFPGRFKMRGAKLPAF